MKTSVTKPFVQKRYRNERKENKRTKPKPGTTLKRPQKVVVVVFGFFLKARLYIDISKHFFFLEIIVYILAQVSVQLSNLTLPTSLKK